MSNQAKQAPETAPRVRIAPSPTGGLHVGTARTALFNWLYAKKHKGTFILRIEDTDRARSTLEFEKAILEDLKWLGLTWDEGVEVGGKFGPYKQIERTALYLPFLEKLLAADLAYYCYCTPEDLAADRKKLLSSGKPPVYVGRCCHLKKEEHDTHRKAGRAPVIRFRVTREEITFKDEIRGEMKFHGDDFGDFVIAKRDGEPLFLLANIIDDGLMKITHVIRGEDHLPNTPKQILLAKALGFTPPKYAHLPLLLNPDRSKMSKRAGPTHVGEYRKLGYLPDAIINYLALLGWNPGTTQELYDRDALAEAFSLEQVNKSGAVFDLKRLQWMNGLYLRKISVKELIPMLRPFLPEVGKKSSDEMIERVFTTIKERVSYLAEVPALSDFYFTEALKYEPALLVWKKSTKEKSLEALQATHNFISEMSDKDFLKTETIEAALKAFVKEGGRSVGEVFWPLRVALTGKEASPGPQEVLWVIGKEKGLQRVKAAIALLEKSNV
jgi:nondiscriminating glutamyl-tRNA synthetase